MCEGGPPLYCVDTKVGNWFVTVNASVVEFKRIADGDAVWSMPESTISHDGYPIVHGDRIREEDRESLTRLT